MHLHQLVARQAKHARKISCALIPQVKVTEQVSLVATQSSPSVPFVPSTIRSITNRFAAIDFIGLENPITRNTSSITVIKSVH